MWAIHSLQLLIRYPIVRHVDMFLRVRLWSQKFLVWFYVVMRALYICHGNWRTSDRWWCSIATQSQTDNHSHKFYQVFDAVAVSSMSIYLKWNSTRKENYYSEQRKKNEWNVWAEFSTSLPLLLLGEHDLEGQINSVHG